MDLRLRLFYFDVEIYNLLTHFCPMFHLYPCNNKFSGVFGGCKMGILVINEKWIKTFLGFICINYLKDIVPTLILKTEFHAKRITVCEARWIKFCSVRKSC